MFRVGSLALALLGRMRKAQAPNFAAAGRRSLALNRIVEALLLICQIVTS
jgi:hypothetical protein